MKPQSKTTDPAKELRVAVISWDTRNDDAENPSRKVRGYASVFNQPTDLGWFTEEVATGFFDDALASSELDVRALFNHDSNLILARHRAGAESNTLSLGVDANGLWYEFDAPNNTQGDDLLESLRRGDISQSSFGFTVKDARWEIKDEKDHRILLKAGQIYDVSPVTFPAYPQASVGLRTRDAALESGAIKAAESSHRDLEILELEINIRKRKV